MFFGKNMEKEKLPKYLLLDVDGTIWKCGKPLPGIPEAIAAIKKLGVKVKILTNNTTFCRKDFANKLVNCGIKDIKEDDVFSSGYGCALMMKKSGIKSAFAVGFAGLKEEARLQGITVHDLKSSEKYPVVDAILMANSRSFTFETLTRICTIFHKSPGCKLFGANPDMTNICAGNTILGGGAIVATAEAMFGQKACNVGKPSNEMMEVLLDHLKAKPEEMMIVGDRLPTDIEFGVTHGMKAVFVLTGVDKKANLDEIPENLRPTYVLPSLANLPCFFEENFQSYKKKHSSLLKSPTIVKVKTEGTKKTASKIPKKVITHKKKIEI